MEDDATRDFLYNFISLFLLLVLVHTGYGIWLDGYSSHPISLFLIGFVAVTNASYFYATGRWIHPKYNSTFRSFAPTFCATLLLIITAGIDAWTYDLPVIAAFALSNYLQYRSQKHPPAWLP